MQNQLMTSLTRLGSAFAFAALAGCSTMSTQTHKDQECMVGHEVKNSLLLAFVFTANTGEQYSIPCREGKTAAQTTYIGRDTNGNLNPTAALFALEYNRNVQEKIKTGTETNDKNTKDFYKDVSYFFGYYLKKIGGLTIDNIQEYVDGLSEPKAPVVPTPAQPKAVLRCGTGSSIIRSCAPETTKTLTLE